MESAHTLAISTAVFYVGFMLAPTGSYEERALSKLLKIFIFLTVLSTIVEVLS